MDFKLHDLKGPQSDLSVWTLRLAINRYSYLLTAVLEIAHKVTLGALEVCELHSNGLTGALKVLSTLR